MKRLLTGLLVVGATWAWGTSAQAQEEEAPRGPDAGALFDRLDKNNDGALAADEIDTERRRFFDRLLRGAGKEEGESLTRDEFVAALSERGPQRAGQRGEGRMGQLFERLRSFDSDGDAKIALDEVPEQRRGMFERLLDQFDTDDDDALSTAEIRQAMQQIVQLASSRARQRPRPADAAPEAQPAETEVAQQDQPRRSEEGQRGRQRPQRGDGQGPVGRPELGGRLLSLLDKDGDGQLSAEEIAAAPAALKQLDRDGDGAISRRELIARGGAAAPGRPQGRPNPGQFLDRIMQADADGDGKLSKDEAPERLQRRLDGWDKNDDGYLDRDELGAGMAEMVRQRGGQGRPGRPGQRARDDSRTENK